jgi:hypothetical protein
MKRTLFAIGLLVACALFSGCASQLQMVSDEPVCMPNTLPPQVMQAAQKVLLKMHFDIEKNDLEARYIRTRPLSGAQFFEFWRKDNASAFAREQANLHSIRRVVELDFYPENTTTCIQCRVNVSRLSIPERPIQGFSYMGGLYTDSHTREQTLDVGTERTEGIEWLDIGPDHDLERKILELIQQDIQKGTSR